MRVSSRLGDKDEVTAINGDISIRARGGRPRHLAPIHYEDAPAALRELPPPAPAHPRHPRTLRGASMQQVRAQLCLVRSPEDESCRGREPDTTSSLPSITHHSLTTIAQVSCLERDLQ
ncbi:hypothetical protein HF086_003408 [Spodoptera exigua]|uniref:Uncharacterized protein n=1 Tax=Spodoptera exigua TaxID=7107 RepID=A0A922SG95_SPOEX|nr:hypothetical protein HF086_003408 [Spodoptera exigua]